MTIPKNTNRAKAAIANAHNIRVYSLSNNFSGAPLAESPVVWGGPVVQGRYMDLIHVSQVEFLARELAGSKLTVDNDRYTIQVHSNLWYEFTTHDWRLEADDTRSCACGARRTEVLS